VTWSCIKWYINIDVCDWQNQYRKQTEIKRETKTNVNRRKTQNLNWATRISSKTRVKLMYAGTRRLTQANGQSPVNVLNEVKEGNRNYEQCKQILSHLCYRHCATVIQFRATKWRLYSNWHEPVSSCRNVVLIEIYKPIRMQQSVLIVNVPGYDETFSGALILLRSSILG
jgi:hypothetical protein